MPSKPRSRKYRRGAHDAGARAGIGEIERAAAALLHLAHPGLDVQAGQAGMKGGDERRSVRVALRRDRAVAIERSDMGEDVGDAMAAQFSASAS